MAAKDKNASFSINLRIWFIEHKVNTSMDYCSSFLRFFFNN